MARKQTQVLGRFERGINNIADPRDVHQQSSPDVKGLFIDKIGRLRMGGTVNNTGAGAIDLDPTHEEGSAIAPSFEPGYGLGVFKSDYTIYPNILRNHQVATNVDGWHLDDGAGNWLHDNTNNKLEYTYDGDGNETYKLYQTAANFWDGNVGTLGKTYYFQYTMSDLGNWNDAECKFYIESTSGFANADTFLPVADGTHTVKFTSTSGSGDNTHPFILHVDNLSDPFGASVPTFKITNLKLFREPEPGEQEYIVISYGNQIMMQKTLDLAAGGTIYDQIADISSSTTHKVQYQQIDGALRIYNDDISSTGYNGTIKWYGLVNQTRFKDNGGDGDDGSHSYLYFEEDNAKLTSPVGGALSVVNHDTDDIAHDTLHDHDPNAAHSVNVVLQHVAEGSEIASGWDNTTGPNTWKAAVSFIYDGNQESDLLELSNAVTVPADEKVRVMCIINSDTGVYTATDSDNPIHWNPRITGIRIYLRENDSGLPMNWYYAMEVNMYNGGKKPQDASFNNWFFQTENNALGCATEYYLNPPRFLTYKSLTGRKGNPSLETNFVNYRLATFINRRLYVAGISYTDVNNALQIHEDRLIKSEPNQFDILPASKFMDVAVGDGDKITALVSYKNKLVQFKKHKMFIINVSKQFEFIESEHDRMGVDEPFQVHKCKDGIYWANEFGAFHYNGQQIQEITMNKINKSIWGQNAYTKDNNPSIAYDPIGNKTYFIESLKASQSKHHMVYDNVLKSWTWNGDTATCLTNANKFTNHVNINNSTHPVVCAINDTTNTLRSISDTSVSKTGTANVNFSTPDFDFGQPGVKKNIYGVKVTYTTNNGGNSGVFCRYYTDGGAVSVAFDNTASINYTESGNAGLEDTSVSSWDVAELYTANKGTIECYSFQLLFYNLATVPAGFEVNDITILYSFRSVK